MIELIKILSVLLYAINMGMAVYFYTKRKYKKSIIWLLFAIIIGK